MTKAFPEILPSASQGHSVFGVLPTELRTSLWFLAQKSLSADPKRRGKGSEDRPSLPSEPHREEVLNCSTYAFICPARRYLFRIVCVGLSLLSFVRFNCFNFLLSPRWYYRDSLTNQVSKGISEQTLKSDEKQRCVKLHVTTE